MEDVFIMSLFWICVLAWYGTALNITVYTWIEVIWLSLLDWIQHCEGWRGAQDGVSSLKTDGKFSRKTTSSGTSSSCQKLYLRSKVDLFGILKDWSLQTATSKQVAKFFVSGQVSITRISDYSAVLGSVASCGFLKPRINLAFVQRLV